MAPSILSTILQGTAITTATATGAFVVWTKHCTFVDLSPATDPISKSPFFQKYNPDSKTTPTHDLCIRRIPIFKLRADLVEDANRGGTKLVEAFCAGIWSGFGNALHSPTPTSASPFSLQTCHVTHPFPPIPVTCLPPFLSTAASPENLHTDPGV